MNIKNIRVATTQLVSNPSNLIVPFVPKGTNSSLPPRRESINLKPCTFQSHLTLLGFAAKTIAPHDGSIHSFCQEKRVSVLLFCFWLIWRNGLVDLEVDFFLVDAFWTIFRSKWFFKLTIDHTRPWNETNNLYLTKRSQTRCKVSFKKTSPLFRFLLVAVQFQGVFCFFSWDVSFPEFLMVTIIDELKTIDPYE